MEWYSTFLWFSKKGKLLTHQMYVTIQSHNPIAQQKCYPISPSRGIIQSHSTDLLSILTQQRYYPVSILTQQRYYSFSLKRGTMNPNSTEVLRILTQQRFYPFSLQRGIIYSHLTKELIFHPFSLHRGIIYSPPT